MSDRRRINGPSGGTSAPVFSKYLTKDSKNHPERPSRNRQPNVLRKIFLKTGVTPSASGSAYLELEPSQPSNQSAPGLTFSLYFWSQTYILMSNMRHLPRDGDEDIGVIIGDRWPKSGVEVNITILEGEEDHWWGDDKSFGSLTAGGWGMMSVLSGCITVASAAIADAGIDCVDVVSGGVAALVRSPSNSDEDGSTSLVLDPVPSEHKEILAACIVAYLPARDEITDLWVKGDIGHSTESNTDDPSYEELTENAVQAALGAHRVLIGALKETSDMKFRR
ncbi:hypothetical protein DID88_003122 [Monilinia fructigena]|uniref:Uncharacterized protein n=1 Tax=Monilinia fructigena TaxID=38457 RepID=A0A395IVP5_9HELO|nr:hypothetical protein DID88_003122 [Monilinia fructigena]